MFYTTKLAFYSVNSNQNSSQEEQIEVGECLLSFGAESFVFQFAIQKYKY